MIQRMLEGIGLLREDVSNLRRRVGRIEHSIKHLTMKRMAAWLNAPARGQGSQVEGARRYIANLQAEIALLQDELALAEQASAMVQEGDLVTHRGAYHRATFVEPGRRGGKFYIVGHRVSADGLVSQVKKHLYDDWENRR